MDYFGTGMITEEKESPRKHVTTSTNRHLLMESPGRALFRDVFSPRIIFRGENMQTSTGSDQGTPNTPSRYGLGTPCHLDFEPIDDTLMTAAKPSGPPDESRDGLDSASAVGSPDLRRPLTSRTERTPERSSFRPVQSPSSVSGPGLGWQPRSVAAHRSPLALLEPVGRLVVASPLSAASSGSPVRRRPEWKTHRSPFAVQPATPVSHLALTGALGRHRSSWTSSPLSLAAGTASLQLLLSGGLSPLVASRSESVPSPGKSTAASPTGHQSNIPTVQQTHHQTRAAPDDSAHQPYSPAESRSEPADDVADGEIDDEADTSKTSVDSDEDLDQLDVPQAFCKPLLDGPDLLCSNRHLAYPHMDTPVLGNSHQYTRFGRVRFTVFPGLRWARDPMERRRQLAVARGIQGKARRGKRKPTRGKAKQAAAK